MAKYAPWFKAPTNKHIETYKAFDVDRLGNQYLLTIYAYFDKKGNRHDDIIRVEHNAIVPICPREFVDAMMGRSKYQNSQKEATDV
jgi:hypothetical protein